MQPGAKGERRAADLPRKFKLRHYPALDQLAVVPLSLRQPDQATERSERLALACGRLANHIRAKKRRDPNFDDQPSKRSVSLGVVR
jgi:hypothetical protein